MSEELISQEFKWVINIKNSLLYRFLKKFNLHKILEKHLPSPRDILLKKVPSNSICVEIGVWSGEFTQRILNVVNPKKLYLIDPWLSYENYYQFDNNAEKYSQSSQDLRYKSVLKRFKKEIETGKIEVFRDTSNNVIDSILKNQKFDFVYIDGNHKYEFVLNDLKNFLPHITSRGFFGLDDYNFKSVREAIKDFTSIYKPYKQELMKYNQYYIKP